MRISLTVAFAISIIAAPVSSARADEIPTLHVEEICHGIVSQAGYGLTAGDPKVAFKQCMDAEAQDREALKKEWSEFSADDKRHCTAETQMGGEASYTELITCLEMARDVEKERSDAAQPAQEAKSTKSKRRRAHDKRG
jgi:hypothetical protein